MPSKDMITLIVPSYNEKDNVAPLVERVHKALDGYNYELLLVDDNSTDGTIEAAEGLAAKYPVRVIVRRDEKGLATAVVHGIRNAGGEIIGVMDADLQHPPEVLPGLVRAMEDGADMVFGSRYIPGGGCPNWGRLRRIISKAASAMCHLLLPSTRAVKDPMSGLFMFRRANVDADRLKPIGYKIALEVLLVGDFKNVVEVPYIFEDRSAGASKLKASTQIDYLKHLLSLMARTGELEMFIKFVAVGLTGVGVNAGVYWLLTRLGGLADYDWLAVIIAIEVSIITNFLLNDFFTFVRRRTGKTFLGRLLKFNLSCLTGAGIQWGLFMLFTRAFGLYDMLSLFIAIVVAFLWNYFVNRHWTWR
jgi:dolichol-phosphate mannosyltransferase